MFKYNVGMYGGCFDPLHVGHIHDIIRASAMCKELYVIISFCYTRDSTSKELRYRWILNSCKHLPNVIIKMLEDTAVNKEVYNSDYYWEKGAQEIKDIIGKPIDAVFCGSDYLGTNRFESLYCPESEVIYFDRAEVPISSTDIRAWALDNWDYIPSVCRPHYVKKVLVIGGESSGKSTLVANLALAYNTNYVSEVGRDTCEYAGGEEFMVVDDLVENLLYQRTKTMEALKQSNRILFVDTDSLTTKFYSKFLLEDKKTSDMCNKLADAITSTYEWDLIIFLEPDVEFVQDGTRNEKIKEDREKYSNQIKQIFEEKGLAFETIGGSYLERFNKSKELIGNKLGLITAW